MCRYRITMCTCPVVCVYSSYMVDGLRSLQHQVTDMSANLTTRLDELQSRGVSPSPAVAYYGTEHRGHVETSVALSEIRSQLHELTRSLESCQSEVTEVKRDMVAIKNELDTVQQVKEEIEELREYVDRLELQSHRRKLRLLEQVRVSSAAHPVHRDRRRYNMSSRLLSQYYIVCHNNICLIALRQQQRRYDDTLHAPVYRPLVFFFFCFPR